jgi:ABC-2 type transport system ATP-binding protein
VPGHRRQVTAAEATADAAIVLRDVSVRRGGKDALLELDCDIPRGLVTGLVGPSGSGKTTMMRAIVGVQRAVTGSVVVLGRPAGEPSLRHDIGYMTQAPAVYEDLSVRDNLSYFAALVDTAADDVDRVVTDVHLLDSVDRRVSQLSGGQRARVSLATALLGRPSLLVLDEPTVGLDPVLRAELWDQFRALAASGVTLLVSSHVMDEAARCHSVLLLREGRLVAQDTPTALLERTATADLDAAFLRLVGEPA